MKIALIDNGSLEPEAHRALRRVAAEISRLSGVSVEAISWKHSGRIDPAKLDGICAWTLEPWVRAATARGEREFIFIPFFVSAQGAIGSYLLADVEKLQAQVGGFRFAFTPGLAQQRRLTPVLADQIRRAIAEAAWTKPQVVVVDHGGPSPISAKLRDQVTAEVAELLGDEVLSVTAASMEGEEHAHNHPLLQELLSDPTAVSGNVLIAPLFLLPGRHAGPTGDLAQIAAAAAQARTASQPLHCHFSAPLGAHPDVARTLVLALTRILSTFHAAA